MAHILWTRDAQRGFGPAEILPGASLTFDIEARSEKFLPIRLALTTRCRDLLIDRCIIDNQLVLEHVPAESYGSPYLENSDVELINQVRACFRYQDHTLEEYLKVVRLLRPTQLGQLLGWGVSVNPGQQFSISFQNPTKEPVLVMGVFGGRESSPHPWT